MQLGVGGCSGGWVSGGGQSRSWSVRIKGVIEVSVLLVQGSCTYIRTALHKDRTDSRSA